jgi:hypothetical protein
MVGGRGAGDVFGRSAPEGGCLKEAQFGGEKQPAVDPPDDRQWGCRQCGCRGLSLKRQAESLKSKEQKGCGQRASRGRGRFEQPASVGKDGMRPDPRRRLGVFRQGLHCVSLVA